MSGTFIMHTHNHHADAPSYGRAFAVGITLNMAFVLIEAWYGWQSDSLALLADAGHNLSDVGGLLLAWAAITAARFKANERYSYGWRRGSILASFTNAVVLLVAMGALAFEAIQRMTSPSSVDGATVIVVAAIGLLINSLTAWLFMRGSEHDLNIRGAFLHMAGDALVSAGVVVAGLLYLWQGWSWLDPLVSLFIALLIIVGTWSLFRRSLHLLFDGVPDNVDLPAVKRSLLELPGVLAVHDLHIWALSTTNNALTVHMVAEAGSDSQQLLSKATHVLDHNYALNHVTIQIEEATYVADCKSDRCGLQS